MKTEVKVREIAKRLAELIDHNGQMAENRDWEVLHAALAVLRTLPRATTVAIEDWPFDQ